ncbi:hypothetical protein GCM10007981_18740 [Thermocladium modestius]|uniref:Uncharacterized protein n=1 Tax=Thermocladium modestius TaxID=62609 RepID=A0A830GXG7_9CREN|nr:hypothetical protein [Thermocladium modestius]GGP22485.1 hypothetical protein GCM10007981_18740 [Thermocladium modestius]
MSQPLIQIRITYIHGEVNGAAPNLNVAVNFQLNGAPAVRDNSMEVPFSISASSVPPFLNITIRGAALVQGDPKAINSLASDLRSGKPNQVQALAMQYAMLELALISRELGLPPILPVQPPPPPQQQSNNNIL